MSEFWMFLDDNAQKALNWVRDFFVQSLPVDDPAREPVRSVVIYGEIYGSGVQDMTYGFANGKRGLRVFGIAVNDKYLDHDEQVLVCGKFGLEMVPVLYRGPFSRDIVEKLTDGPTTACNPKDAGKFKGREGVVITPVKERFSDVIGKRCILKNVSADYLGRKDAQDNDN